jgi:opacity protein-like surface antigen
MNKIKFAFVAMLLAASGAFAVGGPTPLVSHEEWTVGQGDLETRFSIEPDLLRGDFHSNNFRVSLGGNYFVTDVFAPGLDVNYEHARGDFFALLPNLKAYWPLQTRLLPYAQVGVGFLHVPGANLFAFSLGPGLNYMLSSNVALGMQFKYELGAGDGTVHRVRFPIQFAIYFKI